MCRDGLYAAIVDACREHGGVRLRLPVGRVLTGDEWSEWHFARDSIVSSQPPHVMTGPEWYAKKLADSAARRDAVAEVQARAPTPRISLSEYLPLLGFLLVAVVAVLYALSEYRTWRRGSVLPRRVFLVGVRCLVISAVSMLLYTKFDDSHRVPLALGGMFVVMLAALLATIILAEFLPSKKE